MKLGWVGPGFGVDSHQSGFGGGAERPGLARGAVGAQRGLRSRLDPSWEVLGLGGCERGAKSPKEQIVHLHRHNASSFLGRGNELVHQHSVSCSCPVE